MLENLIGIVPQLIIRYALSFEHIHTLIIVIYDIIIKAFWENGIGAVVTIKIL